MNLIDYDLEHERQNVGQAEYYSECCEALVVTDDEETTGKGYCSKCGRGLLHNEMYEA